MIRAVVFDFDGVVANSEPLHFRAYRDVLAERGVALTETAYYDLYLGYDDVGAFRAIASDSGVTFTERDIADLVARKALRLAEIDSATSDTILEALFDDQGDPPSIDAEQSAVLIEVVKDFFHQRYVRTQKLRAALKMRRFFATESNVTPIDRGRRELA